MTVAEFSMNNGRENRTNGNEKEGEEEKEALDVSVAVQYERQQGDAKCVPLVFGGGATHQSEESFSRILKIGMRFSLAGHSPRNEQKLQW
jgi:hypothetical protein